MYATISKFDIQNKSSFNERSRKLGMAEIPTLYFVDSEDATRRTLWQIAQEKQLRLETFSHGKNFLRAFNGGPGCLVVEMQLEDMSGLELQQQLIRRGSTLPIVFITEHAATDMTVKAMQNGAETVLEKPIDANQLDESIERALARDSELRRIDAGHKKLQRRLSRLTPKDKAVLALIIEGVPNKEIARRLEVSLRTVEARRQRVFQQTNSKSLADLVKLVVLSRLEPKAGDSGV